MKVVITSPNKYIMLDVVRFTQKRSVEAQQDIIEKLNEIVKAAVDDCQLPEDHIRYLPTGDGICVVIIGLQSVFDAELELALQILANLKGYNDSVTDERRKFEVRIGLNTNTDNKIVDINGGENYAGAGINLSQRVMSAADGNQVLVGQSVFEVLSQREKYMKNLRAFRLVDKHGIVIPVYQYIGPRPGLSTDVPTQFRRPEVGPARLTESVAYYFAHAIRNRRLLIEKQQLGQFAYSAAVLLWFLAQDSLGTIRSSATSPYKRRVPPSPDAPFNVQYEYFDRINFWIINEFAARVVYSELTPYLQYFEGRYLVYVYVNSEGRKKLKAEWPDIYADFGLDKV